MDNRSGKAALKQGLRKLEQIFDAWCQKEERERWKNSMEAVDGKLIRRYQNSDKYNAAVKMD